MANRKLIKDNYDLKCLDGSLVFVEALKAEPTLHLNKPGDYYVLDEEALRAKGERVCEIEDVVQLINGEDWPNFEKRILRPYFGHSVLATSIVAGGSEAQRQAIISGISPAQMTVWPLMKQDKQFVDVPEFNDFNDKGLREGGFAWALGIIRNFGILLEERSKAADDGERKIFIRLWWGLLAVFLLSNIMDAGPLVAWLQVRGTGFPLFTPWPPVAMICLRVFAVILTVILAGGLVLLTWRCHFDADNRFKKGLAAFQNITRQSSLHIGAMMKVRREKLDHLHDDLWAAAITFKEVRWAEDPQKEQASRYRLWASTRSQCIRTAMWINGRRKSLDDLLVNLHNYILMGYAAQTARAEFEAHFTITSWVPENGWWRLLGGHWIARLWGDWGWDRLIFIKGRFWPRLWRVFWVFLAAALVAAFSTWLLWLRYRYSSVGALTWILLGVKLAAVAVPIWFGVHRIYSLVTKLETPDEPKLIIENIRGAMPDEKYTALQVLEKAVTELVEHDANRLLTEEDKHH
jgi:hypothetical protein